LDGKLFLIEMGKYLPKIELINKLVRR